MLVKGDDGGILSNEICRNVMGSKRLERVSNAIKISSRIFCPDGVMSCEDGVAEAFMQYS